jgi:hypothetical protein
LEVASEFLAVDRNGLIDGGMMGDGRWEMEGRSEVCRPSSCWIFVMTEVEISRHEHFTTGLDPDECGSRGKKWFTTVIKGPGTLQERLAWRIEVPIDG